MSQWKALFVCSLLVSCAGDRPRGPRTHAPARDTPPGAPADPPPVAGGQCGRPAGAAVVPQRWQFSDSMPNARCDELATVWGNVAHADRVCASDGDCSLVTGDGNCWSGALNREAAARPEYREGPCGNPASGACAGPSGTARCIAGCCQVQ